MCRLLFLLFLGLFLSSCAFVDKSKQYFSYISPCRQLVKTSQDIIMYHDVIKLDQELTNLKTKIYKKGDESHSFAQLALMYDEQYKDIPMICGHNIGDFINNNKVVFVAQECVNIGKFTDLSKNDIVVITGNSSDTTAPLMILENDGVNMLYQYDSSKQPIFKNNRPVYYFKSYYYFNKEFTRDYLNYRFRLSLLKSKYNIKLSDIDIKDIKKKYQSALDKKSQILQKTQGDTLYICSDIGYDYTNISSIYDLHRVN